jgi:phosphohistidine phosphatase
MRTLYLLRHAKSSWDDRAIADFDRPLNDRGRRAAPFMGELIRKRGLVPQAIVSSPALRARETAEAAAAAAGYSGVILFDASVYEASPNDLRKIIAGFDNSWSAAMLVGHNPGMEGIVYYLTGHVEPMPTAALAIIELEIDKWAELDEGMGRLDTVIRPREEMGASV